MSKSTGRRMQIQLQGRIDAILQRLVNEEIDEAEALEQLTGNGLTEAGAARHVDRVMGRLA